MLKKVWWNSNDGFYVSPIISITVKTFEFNLDQTFWIILDTNCDKNNVYESYVCKIWNYNIKI